MTWRMFPLLDYFQATMTLEMSDPESVMQVSPAVVVVVVMGVMMVVEWVVVWG